MKKSILTLIVGIFLATSLTGCKFGFHRKIKEMKKNPEKFVLYIMDKKLDLTKEQEKNIKATLKPFFQEMKAERAKQMKKHKSVLTKVEKGTLEKADILKVMNDKHNHMKTKQDKIASVIMDVYKVLTTEQRKKLVKLVNEHHNMFHN